MKRYLIALILLILIAGNAWGATRGYSGNYMQKGISGHSVLNYDAVGDGSTNCHVAFEEAIAAAASAGGIVIVPTAATSYIIEDDVTVPAGVTIIFREGAKLSISSSKTFAFADRSGISAGLYQIFTGAGSVTLGVGSCEYVLPQWWGALGDDSTACETPIEAAISAAGNIGKVYLPSGTYKISNPIDNFAYGTVRDTTKGMLLQGASISDTIIKYYGTSGYGIMLWNSDLDTETAAENVSYVTLRDLQIQAPDISSTGGGLEFVGSNHCLLENVSFYDINTTYGTAINLRRRNLVQTEDSFTHGTNLDFTDGGGASDKYAILFTTTSAGRVKSVTVTLGKTGAPAGTITASIFEDDTGDPDALVTDSVASATVSCNALSAAAGGATQQFTWAYDDQAVITNTTDYWLVLETSGYTYANGVTEVRLRVEADPAGGDILSIYDGTGLSWSADDDGANNVVTIGKSQGQVNVLRSVQIGDNSGQAAVGINLDDNNQLHILNTNVYALAGITMGGSGRIRGIQSNIDSSNGRPLNFTGSGGLSRWANCYFEGADSSAHAYYIGGGRHSFWGCELGGTGGFTWAEGADIKFINSKGPGMKTDDPTMLPPLDFRHRIYTPDWTDGIVVSSGGTTSTDADALTGTAWFLDDAADYITLWFDNTSERQQWYPTRGTYLVTVYAKNTGTLGSSELRLYYHEGDNSGTELASELFGMSARHQAYSMLVNWQNDDLSDSVGKGLFFRAQSTADNADIYISHVEFRFLGADVPSQHDTISYSTFPSDADGGRESSHLFIGVNLGAESLDETDFATHASWDTVGDFDDTGDNATYSHAAGSGTLTQTSGNMVVSGDAKRWYRFTYTVSGVGGDPAAEITTSFAQTAQSLDLTNGTHNLDFRCKNTAPGDFVISATSDSGDDAFTLDDVTLRKTNEQSVLAAVTASHDGTSIDEKGQWSIKANDGDDGSAPSKGISGDSAGDIVVDGDLTISGDDLVMATNTDKNILVADGTNYNPVAMTGDVSITNGGVTAVGNDSHDHTGTSLSGIDISADTNLAVTAPIVLTDDTLSFAGDYAGIQILDHNAVATTVNLVAVPVKVTIFDTDLPEQTSNADHTNDRITIGGSGVYRVNASFTAFSAAANKVFCGKAYEITVTGKTITGASQANPCVITAVGHGFSNGDEVKLMAIVGMVELNDQIYTVANKGDDTFELNDTEAANVDSGLYVAYDSAGTAHLAVKATHGHRKFAIQNDEGNLSSNSIADLTEGNYLEYYVKGITDATNMTFVAGNMDMNKL